MESNLDPVFVLMRTSGRPVFFNKCYESIKKQTYKNIVLIVHTDDPNDEYVKGDVIIKSDRISGNGSGFYNLYCNKLLKAIPKDAKGWYHFIDDDDMYYSNDVIEKLVENAKRECINVGRSQRRDGVIYPKRWKNQHSFQTECFFLHTDHKNSATWWERRGGDHNYSRQLTKILETNWIDIIICKAQAGKGFGRRMDFDEQLKLLNKNVKISRCGARRNGPDFFKVRYLVDVPGRDHVRGNKNDIKFLHKDYANVLKKEKKIEILKKDE